MPDYTRKDILVLWGKRNLRLKDNFTIVLVRPEKPENVGLVARALKNTGFEKLRIVQDKQILKKAEVTAVHSEDILKKARFFPDVPCAVSDIDVIFAATAKRRKNFTILSFQVALMKMIEYSSLSRIGLMFGNERTGLTTGELLHSNFRFSIPQRTRQPSYNLSSAVLITLFHLFSREEVSAGMPVQKKPISREEQENCIRMIIEKLDRGGFFHDTNKQHVTEMVHDLFGRLAMTERDRKLLLAIFSKAFKKM